jgi:predicted Zn-dependent protease with MMP-like domain
MNPGWDVLEQGAREEVAATLAELPSALREAAGQLPVSYERRPNRAMVRDGLDEDLLGLFVGDPLGEAGSGTVLPAQVLLFLENLWEFVEGDWDGYLDEVQTTYLHELGHYLGLDELDLEQRGLE